EKPEARVFRAYEKIVGGFKRPKLDDLLGLFELPDPREGYSPETKAKVAEVEQFDHFSSSSSSWGGRRLGCFLRSSFSWYFCMCERFRIPSTWLQGTLLYPWLWLRRNCISCFAASRCDAFPVFMMIPVLYSFTSVGCTALD